VAKIYMIRKPASTLPVGQAYSGEKAILERPPNEWNVLSLTGCPESTVPGWRRGARDYRCPRLHRAHRGVIRPIRAGGWK
jgi:hypothetical protein